VAYFLITTLRMSRLYIGSAQRGHFFQAFTLS